MPRSREDQIEATKNAALAALAMKPDKSWTDAAKAMHTTQREQHGVTGELSRNAAKKEYGCGGDPINASRKLLGTDPDLFPKLLNNSIRKEVLDEAEARRKPAPESTGGEQAQGPADPVAATADSGEPAEAKDTEGSKVSKAVNPPPSQAVAELSGDGANGLIAQLDQAEQALAKAESDFDRLKVRDGAKALEAAAAILGRKDIEVKFSAIVMKAERAIALSNPPRQGDRTDLLPQGNKLISPKTLTVIRQAQPEDAKLFQKILDHSIKKGKPLTRAALKRAKDAAAKLENIKRENPTLAVKVESGEVTLRQALDEMERDKKLEELRKENPDLAAEVDGGLSLQEALKRQAEQNGSDGQGEDPIKTQTAPKPKTQPDGTPDGQGDSGSPSDESKEDESKEDDQPLETARHFKRQYKLIALRYQALLLELAPDRRGEIEAIRKAVKEMPPDEVREELDEVKRELEQAD